MLLRPECCKTKEFNAVNMRQARATAAHVGSCPCGVIRLVSLHVGHGPAALDAHAGHLPLNIDEWEHHRIRTSRLHDRCIPALPRCLSRPQHSDPTAERTQSQSAWPTPVGLAPETDAVLARNRHVIRITPGRRVERGRARREREEAGARRATVTPSAAARLCAAGPGCRAKRAEFVRRRVVRPVWVRSFGDEQDRVSSTACVAKERGDGTTVTIRREQKLRLAKNEGGWRPWLRQKRG
eukprot:6188095-Pleurochrysis_carterae.AAC.5